MINMLVTENEALNIIGGRAYEIGASVEGRATMNPYSEDTKAYDVWVDAYRLGCKSRPLVNENR